VSRVAGARLEFDAEAREDLASHLEPGQDQGFTDLDVRLSLELGRDQRAGRGVAGADVLGQGGLHQAEPGRARREGRGGDHGAEYSARPLALRARGAASPTS